MAVQLWSNLPLFFQQFGLPLYQIRYIPDNLDIKTYYPLLLYLFMLLQHIENMYVIVDTSFGTIKQLSLITKKMRMKIKKNPNNQTRQNCFISTVSLGREGRVGTRKKKKKMMLQL